MVQAVMYHDLCTKRSRGGCRRVDDYAPAEYIMFAYDEFTLSVRMPTHRCMYVRYLMDALW